MKDTNSKLKRSLLFSSHLKDAKTKNGDIFVIKKPSWIYQDKPNFLQIFCKIWGLWHTLTDTNLRPLAQILCKDWGLWHTLTDHSNNSSLQKELLDPWRWFSFQRDLPEGHVMQWKSCAAVSAMLAIPGWLRKKPLSHRFRICKKKKHKICLNFPL